MSEQTTAESTIEIGLPYPGSPLKKPKTLQGPEERPPPPLVSKSQAAWKGRIEAFRQRVPAA